MMLNLVKVHSLNCFFLNFLTYFLNDLKSNFLIFRQLNTLESKLKNNFLSRVNSIFFTVEFIQIQELSFLSEYFLVTALFCFTLFFLFALKFVSKNKPFLIKFRYDNQLIFLLIFILFCYLVLVYQQTYISFLMLTSFNNTIFNDQLSFVSKFIIGLTSVFYLIFINKYLKDQKLSNFEYCVILLISIFGFFLLCSVNDLITAYLAIELQGLAFYVLASFKKSSNFSVESGVKYFVLGSLSTALFLLGATLIYGLSGSIIFTDFKDFFIWIFSANSLFFAFDSITQFFEVFQEKTFLTESNELAKLHSINDRLNSLGNNSTFSITEFDFLKPNFENFGLNSNYLNNINLSWDIVAKFLKYYDESDLNSFLNFYDRMGFSDLNFLRTTFLISSVNDFLIETSYQTSSINIFYVLEDSQLNLQSFENLKTYLFVANYYEDVEFDSFFGISNGFSLNNSLTSDSYSNSLYGILDSYYLNNANIVPLPDSVNYSPEESCLTKSLFNNILNYNLQYFIYNNVYSFSLVQISNINSFFANDSSLGSLVSKFEFDYNFILIGFLIVILALFFKLALAPFHLWSPDVYEGSPSSSTFFFMVLSKFGIFVLLLRLCYFSFYSFISYWQFYSLTIASISIFVGAVAGLKQRKLKSLLTYSSINNMGFVLLAFSAGSFEGIQVSFYYLIVYMIANICIWAIVLNLNLKNFLNLDKQNRDLGDFALLQESNNVIAQGLGITLFSLAGLPPMVGFLAKMGVFKVLNGVSAYYISVFNILFSVIATFYYLRITKIIFFENFLVGHLYISLNAKHTFVLNLLIFSLVFLFFNPMFLYLYSYKLTLFLDKTFF